MFFDSIESDEAAAKALNLTGTTDRQALNELISDFFSGDKRTDSESNDGSESEEDVTLIDGVDDSGPSLPHDDYFIGSDSDTDSESVLIPGDVEVDVAAEILKGYDDVLVHPETAIEMEKVCMHECKCKAYRNGKCFKKLSSELVLSIRQNMSAMSDYERDLIIMGKISSTMNCSKKTERPKQKIQTDRKHQSTTYFIEGWKVCRDAFKFVHAISQDKLTACLKWYKENGLTPRVKKSGGRRNNPRFLMHDDIKKVVSFITLYTEANAIILPGRIPGFKDYRMKLLPSSVTKSSVFRLYREAMNKNGDRAVKISSFRRLWNTILPYIVLCKPMTDLCWECQKNNYQVYRSANLPEVVKSAKLRKQEEHLRIVDIERNNYREMVANAKKTVAELVQPTHLGTNNACSKEMHMHYSFDFAQQVHIPSDPLQPGPIYFLVPRKCGIFGVHCEALPEQVNYLIDEAASSSKGSNAVITYIHNFFKNYGLGETDADLHCDNCSGQNKNRFMLWYLAWRVMHGLHRTITLNFLITGHTKFSPDWCFGLLKQKFRKTRVCSIDELASVVSSSTTTGVNIPQLVMNSNGEIQVEHFDWSGFLQPHCKPLVGIKSYQHFRFSADKPGVVFCKQYAHSTDEVEFTLLKDRNVKPPFSEPPVIPPPGLNAKRQWYLYDNIRDYCSEETRDITCPRPTVHKPSTYNLIDSDDDDEPPTKRQAVGTDARGRRQGRGRSQGRKK